MAQDNESLVCKSTVKNLSHTMQKSKIAGVITAGNTLTVQKRAFLLSICTQWSALGFAFYFSQKGVCFSFTFLPKISCGCLCSGVNSRDNALYVCGPSRSAENINNHKNIQFLWSWILACQERWCNHTPTSDEQVERLCVETMVSSFNEGRKPPDHKAACRHRSRRWPSSSR